MLTAILGLLIFSESLPPLWFLGAAMLVAGNVIIGRRDEGGKDGTQRAEEETQSGRGGAYVDGDSDAELQESGVLLGDRGEFEEGVDADLEAVLERKRRQDEEDVLQLGSDTD